MAKILFVLTGASYWTLKDGHRHPTGYWAEEFGPRTALSPRLATRSPWLRRVQWCPPWTC
jgi:hypothetical protein